MKSAPISRRDENFIVFLAPLINSVAGIAIDLFAPSIPSIGHEFATSASTMQNTITVTLLFYAVGQIFFGFLADWRGRRPSIVLGLFLFLVGSLVAAGSQSIDMLMFARGLQGFSIGACQVVSRALLVDKLKGDRFRIAIVYLSLAFGLGPVISPYLGGLIEENAGWRWNFVAYFVYGSVVLAFVMFGLKESLSAAARKTPRQSFAGYRDILTNRSFLSAVVMLGASFSAFLLWNVIGPYLVQEQLGQSSSFFGSTALAVGTGYLAGTALNRTLIKRFSGARLIGGGLGLFSVGIALIAASGTSLNLYTLLSGVVLIAFAQGFIFSNALARSMALFPNQAGAAASLQGCLMLLIGSAASALVSAIPIESNAVAALIFGCLLAVAFLASVQLRRVPAVA